MLLSIIIPIYNVEKYIEKCIMSVLNQQYLDDVEIILVDDCGVDNSMCILNHIIKQYPQYNLKIISHNKNKGLSAARNSGVKQALGKYIFFLDSDDELPQNTIKYFFEKYNQYGENIDFYIGNFILDGSINLSKLYTHKELFSNNEEILSSYLNNEWYTMAWGKFINKSYFIDRQLFFPIKRLHEDIYFSWKLALTASKMVIINQDIYIYKIRDNSITTRKKRKNYTDKFWILREQHNMILNYLPKTNRVENIITNLMFNFKLDISISNLKQIEKQILSKWLIKEFGTYSKHITSIKSLFKVIIIKLPINITATIFNLLNFHYKWK